MEEEEEFVFTQLLDLQDLSATAVACRLCEYPGIKNQVKNFFNKYVSNRRSGIPMKQGLVTFEVPSIVSETINQLPLTQAQKMKIQKKIWEFGDQFCDWVGYLTHDLKLDKKYAEMIYWTSNGTIDVDKVFKLSWMSFPGESTRPTSRRDVNREWIYEIFKPLHVLACIFAQGDFIINHQAEIIEEIKSVFPSFKIDANCDTVERIMSYVICCFVESKSGNFPTGQHPPSKILDFMNCTSCCFHKAYFYFWNHLDQAEQLKYLKLSKGYLKFENNTHKFKYRENLFPISNFIILKTNYMGKDELILQNFDYIFFNFLKRESYQKFCLPLLEQYFLIYLDKCKFKIGFFLHQVFEELNYSILMYNDFCLHIQIIKFLLENIPGTEKQKAFCSNFNVATLGLFDVFCIPVLRLIINDKDLKDHRSDIIKLGKDKYFDLITNNNFQLLNEFVNKVLISDHERKQFKQDFSFLDRFIKDCMYDKIGQVLNWMHGDEAYIHKIQLIPVLCRSEVLLIYFKNSSFQELFKWYIETEEKPFIKNCKDDKSVVLKHLCQELIYNIWFYTKGKKFPVMGKMYNIEIFPDVEITKILTSAYGSEVQEFKKNELASDESCVKFFCDYEVKYKTEMEFQSDFSTIDKFFYFCLVSPEQVNAVKKSIADNIDHWIEKYGVSIGRYDIVVPLLDWIFGYNLSSNSSILKNKFQNPDEVDSYYKNRVPGLGDNNGANDFGQILYSLD